MTLNIVLYEPEIAANTGTIGRSCVLCGCSLHLIGPLGFSLDDKMIRRSGMGYWHDIDVHVYDDYVQFRALNPHVDSWMCTKRASVRYTDVAYRSGDWIMLGSESSGIDPKLLGAFPQRCLRIPMLKRANISPKTTRGPQSDPADPDAISLNLSNAANIVMYEALRQLGFPKLV